MTEKPTPETLEAESEMYQIQVTERAALAEQLERGRKALDILNKYGPRHRSGCDSRYGAPCGCGLDLAMAELLGTPDAASLSNDTHPATWKYATGENEEIPYDIAAFNDAQRLRREGYATALRGWLPKTTNHEQECAAEAAKRYPLRVRSARIVPDPHGEGEWTTEETNYAARGNYRYVKWPKDGPLCTPPLTAERLTLALELLNDPWTYVEDPNPEGA